MCHRKRRTSGIFPRHAAWHFRFQQMRRIADAAMDHFDKRAQRDMAPSNVSVTSNKPVPPGKIGILLVNLGTPDAPRFWQVRRFLKEFLSDPRVIETPRIFWWPILHFIILVLRPRRIAKHYAAIWNKETGEGPLKAITRSQAEKLAAWIGAGGLNPKRQHAACETFFIAWAMRYRKPDIAQGGGAAGAGPSEVNAAFDSIRSSLRDIVRSAG